MCMLLAVLGVAPGNDDFQMAVRNVVPAGCTFRGFPVAFNHASASKIFDTLLEHKVAREILLARGEVRTRARPNANVCPPVQPRVACWQVVAHGLRVRAAIYPEGVMAVWLILACYFKQK